MNKTSKQNKARGMETKNKLTVTRGEGREDERGEEREGSSQRTCMNDPWMRTTGWGLTVGVGGGWDKEQWGKIGTTVIEQKKF